jgi:hypothetical protein
MQTTKATHKVDKRIPKVVEEVGTSIATVPLTDLDRAALDEMCSAAGVTTVNLIRLALWHYAHHLDIDLPVQVFGIRRDRTH